MVESIKNQINRVDELLKDQVSEYQKSFKNKEVSPRAIIITHEIIEKLRHILDQQTRRVWEKEIAPTLEEKEKKKAKVYFPITDSPEAFKSTTGRAYLSGNKAAHKKLYSFLLKYQPFTSNENYWFKIIREIAKQKHIDLLPQTKSEKVRRITVSSKSGEVSWMPNNVKFGSGVKVLGATINPQTQRIIPTSEVSETIETWVSFKIKDIGVDPQEYCKSSYQKVTTLIEEFDNYF